MDDLLAEFLTETNESLKGTCGFLGVPRLERVTHAAENALGRVRDKVLLPACPIS